MRHVLLASLLIPLAASAAFAGNHHYSHHGMNISTGTEDGRDITDCSQIRVTIDDAPAARAEENVAVGNQQSLRIRTDTNGGIYVSGASDGAFSVKLCKAAAFAEDLAKVRANVSGNQVSLSGNDGNDDSDEHRVMGYYLVRAPRGATLDLMTTNGSISIRNVDGTVRAEAQNGPIGVKNSTGTIDARTQNGPIGLTGGSGRVTLRAQNGPIDVKLSGTTWDGTLDAKSDNGPLSLKLPRGYRSGVVVESDGHGPMRCSGEACRNARRTWDDDDADNRRIELGSGAMVVHLATSNGPVSVKERDLE
jgi:hypothetical protein